jgi:hypothetical protein
MARQQRPHFVRIRFGEAFRSPPRTYRFDTPAERDAFIKGVEAMDGWGGYEIDATS